MHVCILGAFLPQSADIDSFDGVLLAPSVDGRLFKAKCLGKTYNLAARR